MSVCLCLSDIRVSGGLVEGVDECMCVLAVSRDT